MKQGKFISCPGLEGVKHGAPWSRDMIYNSRKTSISPGQGILTVMKRFESKRRVSRAVLRITSLGIFEAFLNGKRVGRDELSPLWTDYRHRVFELEYDVTGRILSDNLLCVRVSPGWWAGRISFGFYGYKPAACCAELELKYDDGGTELVATDGSWSAAVAGPVLFADIWDGEWYDARIPDPALYPGATDWQPAALFTDYRCSIVPFEGERVRVLQRISPLSAEVYSGVDDNGTEYGAAHVLLSRSVSGCESVKLRAGERLTLDFGQNIVGRPRLEIYAGDGTRTECLFAEMKNDSGDPGRGNDGPENTVYIRNYRSARSRFIAVAESANGRRSLNRFTARHTFFGFRYIEISADRDITVRRVTGEVVGSVLKRTGSFSCSDDEVNRLYSNIEWGMTGNYLSVPTDCPQRDERLGWTGDTQIFCGAACYLADTRKFLRKWLADARDSQRGYVGEYGNVIPRVFGEGSGGNAGWADAPLIVAYRLWLMYGNKSVIAENFAAMEEYMEFLTRFGLDGPRPTYGDWLNYEKTDSAYLSVCYYAYDAWLMRYFSELLGRNDRAEYYTALREKIIAHYNAKYVRDGEITERTQTGYLLPLAFGMLDSDMKQSVTALLAAKIKDNACTLSTGFIGTGILNQTLSSVGLDGLAYSLLLNTADPSWLYPVRQGATTVWERWNSYTAERGFGDVGMNSFNHYAYGAVAEWLYAFAAGIRPDPEKPGFSGSFILAPRPDLRAASEIPAGQHRITSVSAEYRRIKSSWKLTDSGCFLWYVTVPKGVAHIEFPLVSPGEREVEINGTRYTAEQLNGTINGKKICFSLPVGEYTLRSPEKE